jgi:hypothetical protein
MTFPSIASTRARGIFSLPAVVLGIIDAVPLSPWA